MTPQIPSPNDTQAYTALAIQVYSGAFFGENFKRCLSDKPEDAYYKAVSEMTFDMTKLDFLQKEPLKGKENPYTLLSAAINIQNFKEANDMLDELFARDTSTADLIAALDIHHSQEMLKKIIFPKGRGYPTNKFRQQEARLFIDRLRARLPRQEFITQILGQSYSHEMTMEDLEFERDRERLKAMETARAPKRLSAAPAESFQGTVAPVRKITSAPPEMVQATFTHLLFHER